MLVATARVRYCAPGVPIRIITSPIRVIPAHKGEARPTLPSYNY
jgi:hypothetical protein